MFSVKIKLKVSKLRIRSPHHVQYWSLALQRRNALDRPAMEDAPVNLSTLSSQAVRPALSVGG